MAHLKDAKSPFSLKVTCMGWLKNASSGDLMTAWDTWARVGWSFGDNGSTTHGEPCSTTLTNPPVVLIGSHKPGFGLICTVVGKNWLAYGRHCVSIQSLV